jgi:hypothetical protein
MYGCYSESTWKINQNIELASTLTSYFWQVFIVSHFREGKRCGCSEIALRESKKITFYKKQRTESQLN